MRRPPRSLRPVLLGCALLVAGAALAQEGGDARRFFDAAQKAFDEGRYVDAAQAFEEAFRIKPHPFPLINAGDAWEKAGEYARAARLFNRVLTLEQSTEQDRTDAIERLARLKPQLSIIEIVGPASRRVRVGDEEFKGGDRVYVFPGDYKVTLADSERSKTRTIKAPAGGSVSVEVESLVGSDEPAPATSASAPAATSSAAPPPPPAEGIQPLTWIALGVGVVGLGAGAVFGLQANATADQYDGGEHTRELYDQFGQQKLLTNVFLGVGVVGVGLGTVLLLGDLGGGGGEPAAEARSTAPQVGVAPLPGGAFIGAHGRF